MMMKIVLVLAALALCTALPSESDEAYHAARQEIQGLMQQGKDDNACRDLAKSIIKEITDAVNVSQKTFNDLDKGHSCKDEGQEQVTAAKKEKKTADEKKSKAAAASTAACTANVKFAAKPLSDLQDKKCGVFWADPAYVTAKRICNNKKTAHTEAEGKAKEAAKMVENAEAAAEKEKKACLCKVKATNSKAMEGLNSANSAANEKAWTKAHHMLCVVAGTAPSKCQVPKCPKVKPVELAPGVAGAQCNSGSATTQPVNARGSARGSAQRKGFVPLISGPKEESIKQGGANPPGVTFHQHCIRDPSRSTGGKMTAYKSYKRVPSDAPWMIGTSTVTMTKGWEVRVFDNYDWKGRHQTFGNCNSNSHTKLYDFCDQRLGSGTWNDKMRSFQISKCS